MTINSFSIDSLISSCNKAFPPTGIYGYLTLLSGDLALGVSYTANVSTNRLTSSVNHGLVSGSRVRLVGGTLPTPTLSNTDYYAIVSSPTTFALATTLANAQSNTPLVLTDAGSGALTFSEQALTVADSLAVLVNKEINHPALPTRVSIDSLGSAVNVDGAAEKPVKTITISNSSASILSYEHYLVIESANGSALGSVPPQTGFLLSTEPTIQNVGSGNSRIISLTLRAKNNPLVTGAVIGTGNS